MLFNDCHLLYVYLQAFSLIVRLLENTPEDDTPDDLSSMTFSSRGNILLPASPKKTGPAEDGSVVLLFLSLIHISIDICNHLWPEHPTRHSAGCPC